jgi:putative phosphoesterase
MKIALLGDVHANLPALEAVLADARQREVAAIWNVGDFVGYGPFPDQVVSRLQAVGALSIVGNYDLKVLKFPAKQKKWRKTKLPQKWLAFQWAYEHLSEASRAYLRSLPQELRLEIEGHSVLLTHGSPASNEETLTPDTPQERLRALLPRARAEVIVCGHSHQAFTRQVDAAWYINTGSVGRPDDGDPRAAYAVLQLEPGNLQVEHIRLVYAVNQATAALRAFGLPEAFAQMLIQGYDLETVLAER